VKAPATDLHDTGVRQHVRETSTQINGRHVDTDTELSVRGMPGRFRFKEHVLTEDGQEWITAYGGPGSGEKAYASFRSFSPQDVRTVHRIEKLRPR
jgi:hypothetical protein